MTEKYIKQQIKFKRLINQNNNDADYNNSK